MTRGSAWLSVLAVFVAGVAIGALAMRLWDDSRPPVGPPMPPHGRWDGPPREFGMRLADDLELTDEQRERIETIQLESRAATDALRDELRPRIRQQIEQTRLLCWLDGDHDHSVQTALEKMSIDILGTPLPHNVIEELIRSIGKINDMSRENQIRAILAGLIASPSFQYR